MKKSLLLLLFVLILFGCTPTEQTVRNSIAAAQGALKTAQLKYYDTCVANPLQTPCVTINKVIAVQHLAKDALYVYCSFSPTDDASKVCVPVKSALPALQSALVNLNQSTADLKGLLQ